MPLAQLRMSAEPLELIELHGPFNGLESRRIAIQDEKHRGIILSIYLLLLLAGLPIWWFVTSGPSYSLPNNLFTTANIAKQYPLKIYLYYESSLILKRCILLKTESVEIASCTVRIELKNFNDFKGVEGDEINLLLRSKSEAYSGIDEIIVHESGDAIDVVEVLKKEFEEFKVDYSPKIKLKFTELTDKRASTSAMISAFESVFSGPLEALKPVILVETIFQIKYFADEFKVENVQRLVSERVDRGRGTIFNLVLIDSKAEPKFNHHYIHGWGIIVFSSETDSAMNLFLNAFLKHLNISSSSSLPFWFLKLRHFYLKKSMDLIHQLNSGFNSNSIKCSLLVYKDILLPASALVSSTKQHISLSEAVKLFELIDRAFHHPDLMAAAYFPDDHKFAVYLPVYLPLFLPILVAFLNFIKEIIRRRRNARTKLKDTITTSSDKIKTN